MRNDELMHYGVGKEDGAPGRGSGRYPLGSGDHPYQRSNDSFMSTVENYRKKGFTNKEIAEAMGLKNESELRKRIAIESNAERAERIATAVRLHEEGLTPSEIGRRMDLNESTVRGLLAPSAMDNANKTQNTADILKQLVDEKGYIDVGIGAELELGVTKTRKDAAIAKLLDEGYVKTTIQVEQLGTGYKTYVDVLAPPGTTYKDVVTHKSDIHPITEYHSLDDGKTFHSLEPPTSVDSSRIMVRYKEDGGIDKDGVIEIRRGVDELSLGNSRYAQVRVAVDDKYYLKGMAVYSDDMPPGVDIIFNSNKPKGSPPEKVFKKLSDDPDNPFGASIKAEGQRHYIDENGVERLSPINKVNEEGDWSKWSKNLASQFLSKQPLPLVKEQLGIAEAEKRAEFEEINKLTNPTVKRVMLNKFADKCDLAAVELKAAALPRQASHVILPFPDMEPDKIYAPNYRPGEKVVLVRYPHGGTFELPVLTVDNKHATADATIHNARDAVGINAKVAEQLSGADFDGDTVLVIPVGKAKIRTTGKLKDLEGFDPKTEYKGYEGMPKVKHQTMQTEMGKVSNLITDMTLQGAPYSDIARAVRHSMVVIDAEKHNLDYKRSYKENRIAELKKKYQGGENKGASTLISRASAETRVPARKMNYRVDPETGKKIYIDTGETYKEKKVNKKTGEVTWVTKPRMVKSTQMAEVDDARKLLSKDPTPTELAYADFANNMKAMANRARKEAKATGPLEYNPSARVTYRPEVDSLNKKLMVAQKNAPRERQALIIANEEVAAKRRSNPDMTEDDLKKVRTQALYKARNKTGAKKQSIEITDREWEAIQAGAIHDTKLMQILNNTDNDKLRERAMPRTPVVISQSKKNRAKAMSDMGYTTQEIADALRISTSSVSDIVNGKL